MPITTEVIDNFLEDFEEGFISCLYLTITLWEIWARKVVMDAEGSTQFFQVEIFKITSVVGENGGWDAEAANNMIQYELGDLNSCS